MEGELSQLTRLLTSAQTQLREMSRGIGPRHDDALNMQNKLQVGITQYYFNITNKVSGFYKIVLEIDVSIWDVTSSLMELKFHYNFLNFKDF